MTVSGDDNYAIGAGRLRFASWSERNAYVDCVYQSWGVSRGRPTPGAAATVTAGGGSIVVSVSAASPDSVTYDVRVDVAGTLQRYAVTATYAAGGGAPTYVAVEVAI